MIKKVVPDLFGPIRTYSDLFGQIRTYSDKDQPKRPKKHQVRTFCAPASRPGRWRAAEAAGKRKKTRNLTKEGTFFCKNRGRNPARGGAAFSSYWEFSQPFHNLRKEMDFPLLLCGVVC